MKQLNDLPLKAVGQSWVRVGDIGQAEDANAVQYNLVRVEGQRSSYIAIMKQGGNSNTIDVVNGIRRVAAICMTFPSSYLQAYCSTNPCLSKRPFARFCTRQEWVWCLPA